jgi:hypothetical protein
MAEDSHFEAAARRCWWHLLETRLPEAAVARRWPVTTPAGFERVLLDHVLEAPWEAVIPSPSPRNAPLLDLVLAIEMAERALAGDVDLAALDRCSLQRRAATGWRAGTGATPAGNGDGPPDTGRSAVRIRARRRRADH